MTNRTHSLRHAGSAIAAALAFTATPGLAQDVAAPFPAAPAPAIVVPDIPPPVTPAPTIVLPAEQPATVQPVPETAVESPEPQPVPAPVATTPRTRVQTPPQAVTEPTPVTAEPVTDEPAALPPIATTEPVAAPSITEATSESTSTTVSNDSGILALILGGLAFLALAIWGFVAIGRRKPVRRYAAESVSPKPATVAPATVVSEPAPARMHEPMAIVPRAETATTPAFAPRPAAASGVLPPAGASVALPASMPQDYAERDALLKRMIAAKPDRANPFTDRGARTRRARLILQSLGRDFSQSEPWIDLSQYPNNWPELARKRSAAA